jgi:hypothetical protein
VAKKDEVVTVDRRTVEKTDRRVKSDSRDRRKESVPVVVERRKLERREKVSRRRQIDPTTCERDYTPAEVEFMNAMNDYKRRSGRMFPTCSEILEVVQALGYVKTVPAMVVASTDAIIAQHAAASIPVETL